MDISLIPMIHQLYIHWKAIQQDGELCLSTTTIRWTNASKTVSVDLYPVIATAAPQATLDDLLEHIQRKDPIQRLKAYFQLGKFLRDKTLTDLHPHKVSRFKRKAARRVYEFYTACGEETIELGDILTATSLAKLSEADFLKVIEDRKAILSLFAGAQNGTGE